MQYRLVVKRVEMKGTIILTKRMYFPIFKLRQADLDGDGKDDFILGAIKRTVFDTSICKRINIWKIEDNTIVPMWLGSKMPRPLYDFEIQKDKEGNMVYTIECENGGLFMVVAYKWRSFGLKFIGYIKREIQLDEAYQILNYQL